MIIKIIVNIYKGGLHKFQRHDLVLIHYYFRVAKFKLTVKYLICRPINNIYL